MVKKVMMSHSTLYTGLRLEMTITALNSETTESTQKRICVMFMAAQK
jgi:hypothetical protein